MSKATAKTKITSVFKTNGSQGVTGANSQSALTGMLDDIYADLINNGVIADVYSASSTYDEGDYCIYDSALYVCNTTISTAEAWNASHWTAVSLKDLMDEKVNTESGKGLSTNDYTTAEKTKLAGIETGAEANIVDTYRVDNTTIIPVNKVLSIPSNLIAKWGNISGTLSSQSDLNTALGNKADTSVTDRINKTLGKYTDRTNITLTASETGKAISKTGEKITKSGWAIAEFTAEKGNEYLFNPGTMDGNVCLFAEKITKVETRNIDYTYTYNTDGTIHTAVATYNGETHTYTYTYTYSEGVLVSEVITDEDGNVVSALPYQYKTSVGSYQPLTILNANAELPADDYCRFVSHFQTDASLTIAVSYNVSDANLTMQVVRDGFTASICTQLSNLSKRISNVSDYASSVGEEQATIEDEVASIESDITDLPDFEHLPLLCGQPMILFGNGTPAEATVPDNWTQLADGGYNWTGLPSALGQQYVNYAVNTGGHYIAVRDGEYGLKWLNC